LYLTRSGLDVNIQQAVDTMSTLYGDKFQTRDPQPAAGERIADVSSFCVAHGLGAEVDVAKDLIRAHFDLDSEPSLHVEEDPDSGESYLEISFATRGEADPLIAAYQKFTATWVRTVPAGARAHIRFTFSVI